MCLLIVFSESKGAVQRWGFYLTLSSESGGIPAERSGRDGAATDVNTDINAAKHTLTFLIENK